MPVYEEKLISPLSVRFSQEHVRTTFRNGMKLEEVVNLVQVEHGASGAPYDVVLRPPFANIEIVRWVPKAPKSQRDPRTTGRTVTTGTVTEVTDVTGTKLLGEEMHWYTKDNRRLYVLQKVATKFWPKKVGVEVDVLFAVPSELLKKYDSFTAGLFAALGDSVHCQSTSIWHWGHAVTNLSGMMNMELERAAFKQLKDDDMSCTLAELVSLPASRSSGYRTQPWDLSASDSTSTSSEDLPALNAVVAMATAAMDPKDTEKHVTKPSKPTKTKLKLTKQNMDPEEEVELQEKEGKQKKGTATRKKAQKKENEREKQNMPQKGKQVNKQRPSTRKGALESKTAEANDSDIEETETSGEDSWSEWCPYFSEYWKGLVTLLEGVWKGPKGETYRMSFEEPGNDAVKGSCKREEGQKVRTFSISYDYDTCLLWWGIQRKFCLDPEELRSNTRYARWYVTGKEEPEFEWLQTGVAPAKNHADSGSGRNSRCRRPLGKGSGKSAKSKK